jgi:hypothetical protein
MHAHSASTSPMLQNARSASPAGEVSTEARAHCRCAFKPHLIMARHVLRLLLGRPPQAQAVVEDHEGVRHSGARIALVLSLMMWSIMSRTPNTFLSIIVFTSSHLVSPYLSLYDPFAHKSEPTSTSKASPTRAAPPP